MVALAHMLPAMFPFPSRPDEKDSVKAQPILVAEEEEIPDSLLHPRWKITKTTPILVSDLDSAVIDLRMPDNIKQQAEYDDSTGVYLIGSKIGSSYLNAPILMSPEEYQEWSRQREIRKFFRLKNAANFATKGKDKFDFADMHFDLGPAEKIFGPGGVRIKTQGTAELKLGANFKIIDNPSLPERNRNTKAIDFDEKINLNVTGKVGDKVNMNLNYNTDATFDFDTKNIKLRYEGKEDEIIKLVEAGNVTFPSNNSLVKGASSLFGVRTDMQFGKLKLQTVFSQKKSTTTSVSSKGGVQLTPFELNIADYEENRHFFLANYFRERYDAAMQKLPNLMTGIQITRVEVWITNKTGTTSNTRNIVGFTELAESRSSRWGSGGTVSSVPSNDANREYNEMITNYPDARNIDQTSTVLDAIPDFSGGVDYEKLASARLLTSSEYTVNKALGYISLKTTLQTDQVLAVAYEFTYNGMTYQVGEFASDFTRAGDALFVKTLKNTSNNPLQKNWSLMMKNVYYLASNVEKTRFKLDIKFQSDTAGVYLNYIPEPTVKDITLLKGLGCDRLDNNNRAHPNGYFDYVEGYTVSEGRVFFPSVEPFGKTLYDFLKLHHVSEDKISKYVFYELYDTTRTAAKQLADKNKFLLIGQFKGTSANVISLGAYNVPQGSVVVTAGGVVLTEGSDYSVDYSAGEVTILNQSIIDAGTNVSVSLESNTDYGMQRKTMLGLNWEYEFSKDLQIGGTFQHLSEQTLTSKVMMGSEPLKNTLWGVNINWKHESQWLTNMLNKLPFLHCTQPSQISFTGEFAHLIAGQAGGTQDNASYIDDFENAKNGIDVSEPRSWSLSSVPNSRMFPEYADKDSVTSGFNRALLAWYNIDPLFTYRSSSLTPSHIKSDLEQLSNHYVRAVYVSELYPNRQQSTYSGATATLPILNLAYYPEERGPYNLTTDMDFDGKLSNPQQRWGGMMRKLDTNDFEMANIEYIEFWLLDPFIYTSREGIASDYGGDLYIDLGEVSEDVLRDGKKFAESTMPVDGTGNFKYSAWGKVPYSTTQTYAFATSPGSRAKQDVGLDGLIDEEERTQPAYANFLNGINVNDSLRAAWNADPANDNYHYFRGSDLDARKASILERYKRINLPQGNSPDSEQQTEGYDTSYKTYPDVEDINQDFTLNEYERFFQYRVSIRPEDLVQGRNFITDVREASVVLRNGNRETVKWYQFRIPLDRYVESVGNFSDFTSIRFMRMFLTKFKHPIVLRFGSLDLVRGEWRIYGQPLTGAAQTGTFEVSAVNIEENNDKRPVNYVLPPGITRATDPSQPQLVEENEQSMNLVVKNLAPNESKAVYKNTLLDLRRYKHLQMFVHENHVLDDVTNLKDGDLAMFIRLGNDYKNNYYEYLIPLSLTPDRNDYNKYNVEDCRMVWPEKNMLDVDLTVFTDIKKERNKSRSTGGASYNQLYSKADPNRPENTVSILGNPSLGEVKTMMIGVRNISHEQKSGEMWVDELRMMEFNSKGGWAASGALNLQLSDVGTVNVTGKIMTNGFGGLEEGVLQRSTDDYKSYSVTANIELGKFFPDKAKVSAPLYYSVSKEERRPKYNPMDTDLELKEALDAIPDKHERDSIESIAVTKTTNTNFSLSNVRVGIKTKRHPMPYDPANFSFSYSHSHRYTTGETTVYEKEDQWRGSLSYNYSPVYKPWEPFKKMKSKSKWAQYPQQFGLNWLPQNISFNTEMLRNYYELQERDMEDLQGQKLPLTFNEQFLWNREFAIRWDLTKNLHMSFQSATHAQIEEPYTPINKDLYPERYEAWKDSVWQSIRHFGTPLDYQQSFTASLQLPLNKLPIFDWVTSDASYTATYNWVRGTDLDDGTNLGNTIANNRQLNINGNFNMETLYNHIPFLKKANDRFKKAASTQRNNKKKSNKNEKDKDKDKSNSKEEKILPKNKDAWQKEVTLTLDSAIIVNHGKKSKRVNVTARTKDGKKYNLKYKVLDDNRIRIKNRDTLQLMLSISPKRPTENQWWYKPAQSAARFLMMVRSISVSYRQNYAMSIPGFLPNIGDAFGQRTGGVLAPGLDFAFGLIDDSYIEKAYNNGWLLLNDNVATPATTNLTTDLQLKATLEPIRDLKIDLNASRTETKAKSIQYMYKGMPATQSGTFTMTTVSLKSAFEGLGDANNGYYSASFERFCNALESFQQQAEAKYGTDVDPYSASVMIPAFLSTYTSSGGGLSFFPALTRLLPNWTLRYTGLSKLPWFRDHFKSVTLNHSYKSVYAVGSYTAKAGVTSQHGFSVPTVSINESFAPLIGVDVTFYNNLTAKVEYRSTRVLNLSMTSIQINESRSNDLVIGLAYKISDFNIFGASGNRKIKKAQRGNKKNTQDSKSSTSSAPKTGVNHDLNMRLDFSLRKQAAITRDIATRTSSASSGNTALKISFMADYTLSRLLTISAYYDRQTNTPLLSSSSYPTTTHDFGLSLKFSLTR
jgi:cell surface protein SprA